MATAARRSHYRRPVIVDSAVYRQGARLPVDCHVHDYDALRAAAEGGEHDFVWVGLFEPDQRRAATTSPTRSACTRSRSRTPSHAHQRPKLERYEGNLFLTSRRSGTSTRTTPSRPARSTCSSATTS